MSDQVKLLSLQRSRRGELILAFDFSVVRSFFGLLVWRWLVYPLLYSYQFILLSLERTTGKKSWLTVVTALGLGVGISIGLVGRPAQVIALPTLAVYGSGPQVEEISINSLAVRAVVKQVDEPCHQLQLVTQTAYVTRSARIGQASAIIICSSNASSSLGELWNAQLGQEILITGDNNGIYHYRIAEIRAVTPEKVADILQQSTETLVLYTYNSTRTEAIVVVAKPTH